MTSSVPSDRPDTKPTPTPTPTSSDPTSRLGATAVTRGTSSTADGREGSAGKSGSSGKTAGLYGSDLTDNLPRAAAAELIGTFLLVLAGTAVAVSSTLSSGSYDGLAPAFSFGLILAALATALGHISGCHLNPAVTLGLTATRKFPMAYVPAYLAAQFVGAILASLTVWAAYGTSARKEALLGAPGPAPGITLLRTGFVEALITFLLVLVIVSVATDDRVPPAAAGLAVGFALFAAVAIGSRITGGSANPARALGPMIVAGSFPMWVVYLLAPVVGGVLAALLYDGLLSKADRPEA
jgi:MIP family channel proteins